MRKHSPANERIKWTYLTYLREARGYCFAEGPFDGVQVRDVDLLDECRLETVSVRRPLGEVDVPQDCPATLPRQLFRGGKTRFPSRRRLLWRSDRLTRPPSASFSLCRRGVTRRSSRGAVLRPAGRRQFSHAYRQALVRIVLDDLEHRLGGVANGAQCLRDVPNRYAALADGGMTKAIDRVSAA